MKRPLDVDKLKAFHLKAISQIKKSLDFTKVTKEYIGCLEDDLEPKIEEHSEKLLKEQDLEDERLGRKKPADGEDS
jgi:hypothetical protein